MVSIGALSRGKIEALAPTFSRLENGAVETITTVVPQLRLFISVLSSQLAHSRFDDIANCSFPDSYVLLDSPQPLAVALKYPCDDSS
jgi:hypothetical protein